MTSSAKTYSSTIKLYKFSAALSMGGVVEKGEKELDIIVPEIKIDIPKIIVEIPKIKEAENEN